MYFSAICAGVPRIFTSGPFDSKLRVSGFWPLLRLRPRPLRFCCPCLIVPCSQPLDKCKYPHMGLAAAPCGPPFELHMPLIAAAHLISRQPLQSRADRILVSVKLPTRMLQSFQRERIFWLGLRDSPSRPMVKCAPKRSLDQLAASLCDVPGVRCVPGRSSATAPKAL